LRHDSGLTSTLRRRSWPRSYRIW